MDVGAENANALVVQHSRRLQRIRGGIQPVHHLQMGSEQEGRRLVIAVAMQLLLAVDGVSQYEDSPRAQ